MDLKRMALRVGLGPPLRAIRRAFEPSWAPQDRADNEHLRMLMAFTLSPDSNCIDVGAGFGHVLKHMIAYAPKGHHIAYEPIPPLFEKLAKEFPEVDLKQAALSNEDGETSFIYVTSDPCFSGLKERTYPKTEELETIHVRIERLDTALPAGYIPHLIKIDVEGAEGRVIEGAISTITNHKPMVVFEHGKGAADHYGTGPADIFELLCKQAGLRIYDLGGEGPFSLDEFEEIFDSNRRWNFVARP